MDEVNFLLELDLTKPSDSEWESPSVLVPKGDGSFRMCTDFRKVNNVTHADSYPLPRINDLIDSVGNAKFVTKLDLLKGYYQIKLAEDSKSLVVVGVTWEEHQVRLRGLFTHLSEHHFIVNLVKSEFGHAAITFLGHVVVQGQVTPITAKFEFLIQVPPPVDRKALRRYFGVAGFYRKFCKNFVVISAPLTDLVSPKKRYFWTDDEC